MRIVAPEKTLKAAYRDPSAQAMGLELPSLPHPNLLDRSVSAEISQWKGAWALSGCMVFVFKDGFATSPGLDGRLFTDHARPALPRAPSLSWGFSSQG